MSMRAHLLLIAATGLLASAVHAQSADLLFESDSVRRVLSAAELDALRQDTLRVQAHDGPEQAFVGPPLPAVLALGGVQLDSLRGRALAQYLIVEARDAYRVVFSIAELSPDFGARQVILARSVDGHPLTEEQGPWRLVVAGERRPARWVRQVNALRLRKAPG